MIHVLSFSAVYYVLLYIVLLINSYTSSNNHVALALYADEVGLNDFSIATAGHGPVRSAWFITPEVVVTSNSYRPEGSFPTNNNLGRGSGSSTLEGTTNWNPTVAEGCYLAGRNASTGILLWRRNVCSSSSTSSSRTTSNRSAPRHSTAVVMPKTIDSGKTTSTITSASAIITLDNAGTLQRWDATSGSLLWNVPLGMFSPTPVQMMTTTTTTERLYSWDENDAVIAVSYRTTVGKREYYPGNVNKNKNYGVQIQQEEEGLSIHSIHTGQPMYYNDDTGLQPLVIYAQDLLLSNVDIVNPNHRQSSSTFNANGATSTHSARIFNVRPITDRKLYIIAGYVPHSPFQAMIASTAHIGIFHVEIIAHSQQYVISKSIPLQQLKATFTASSRGGSSKHNNYNNNNSPTYVDASLFRFAILPRSSLSTQPQPPHYAITVIVPPPDSSTEEQGNYYHKDIISIPITSDTSTTTAAKRSVHFLDSDATRKSTITDIMVQESDNIVMLSIVTSTESRKKNVVKMVRLLSDGQMKFVEQSSPLLDKEDGKGLVTTTAGATSTAQCGVSHTILAQIHPPDVRHPNAYYYSIQIINKVENEEESTKEEIFFNDIPVHILDPATHGPITSIHAISCVPPPTSAGRGLLSTTTTTALRALASTSGGTTIMLQLSERNSGTTFPNSTATLWISEEALAWIQSVTFVDIHPPISSHGHKSTAQSTNNTVLVTTIDDEELPPSVTERWLQQWDIFKSLLPGVSSSSSSTKAATTLHQDEAVERRNINFGFAKRAVVLTSNPPRLFGLDMQKRGKVAWSMMLTDESSSTLFSRHSLIHSGRHGQHHANEILILSQYQETKYAEDQTPALLVEWTCLDGVDGTKLLSGTLELDGSKKVVHISPIRIYTGVHTSGLATLKCRQQSLVLFDDGSVEMVPPSKVGSESLRAYLRDHSSFVHSIDWRRGELHTRQLDISSSDNATVTSSLVGDIFFPPDQEKIVSVTYPSPDEVVQSPVTILGDDALLLKYLNPHLAVIITEVTPEYWKELEEIKNSNIQSQLMSSLLSGGDLSHHDSSREKTKKKPLGVTPTRAGEQDATTSTEIPSTSSLSQQCPSLFINLVDTVSGKLLHRASYSHFSGYADALSNSLRGRNIPVVISENWVLCAFWNYRTKRTDVSVLTLHDGMIDKHGITAFKRPQQETTFSSFESPKPIVLHRTFALSNEVTALGVTQTARGISMKHFIFALGTGQVLSVDRRVLDPRRPSGEPKPAEKAEGLFRYHPIIPLIPQHIISYNLPIEGVSLIKSVAAQVESQSMVFACGGPDVFFVRLAPSKGFDLLPENFNKGLLLVVVISLVGVVLVMQRMSNIETLKATWF